MTNRQIMKTLIRWQNYIRSFDLTRYGLDVSIPVRLTLKQANWLVGVMESQGFYHRGYEDSYLEFYDFEIDPKLTYYVNVYITEIEGWRRRQWYLECVSEPPVVTGEKIWVSLKKAITEGRAAQETYKDFQNGNYRAERRIPVKLTQKEADQIYEYMEAEGFYCYFDGGVKVDPSRSYDLWIDFRDRPWGVSRRIACPDTEEDDE